jgi:hypothetical protein
LAPCATQTFRREAPVDFRAAARPRLLALRTARHSEHGVELAARERLHLATFDTKLLKAFPEIALRPGELS